MLQLIDEIINVQSERLQAYIPLNTLVHTLLRSSVSFSLFVEQSLIMSSTFVHANFNYGTGLGRQARE